MPSKIVVDKQKSMRAVISICKANEESLPEAIAARLPKESGIKDAAKLIIQASCQRIATDGAAMAQADDAYLREEGDDHEPRQQRDATAAALFSGVVELRELFGAIFGAAALRGLGFSRQTPQDPELLARFSLEIVKSIEDKQADGTFPTPRAGITIDFSAQLTALKTNAARLDGHLQKVADEKRELHVALAQKNAAIAAYDDAFQETTNLLEGLFRFAGQHELADKLRPSRRYPGQLEDLPTEVPA